MTQVRGDCWLIEGDKGYVWLAICSQNQPPYETIPQHINNTVHDLRLNENKLKAVFYASLSRFTNLTDLNLTKNEIAYVEDGAFAGQANLQVLQLGYNKLTNLTEGILRGLGHMQCLFLQHNLIKVISTNAFWECPSLSSLDLSSNKLARLDPSTFTSLTRLMVCELAGNPFHCGCGLYSFLTWLEAFNNITHTYDRLQCETPRELFGFPLLSPLADHGRNAHTILSSCRDGVFIPAMTSQPPDSDTSGLGPDMSDRIGPYHQPTTSSSSADPSYSPSIKLHHVSLYSASLLVHIPRPYSKMYILVQYNDSYVSDFMNLKKKKDMITVNGLKAHTNYTFCVASIRNSQRYNHACLFFTTRMQSPNDMRPSPSITTHYIMTILGCLFGMLVVLVLVYCCLRRRRLREEKKKSICVKKTILEMRYGPEAAAVVGAASESSPLQKHHDQPHHHQHSKMPSSASSSMGILHSLANTSSSHLSSIPQVEKIATAFSEAMAANKGNYMDVRTSASGEDRGREGVVLVRAGEHDLWEDEGGDMGEDSDDEGRGSASEISTIAMEVDKVNQIINNCIDALKLDTVTTTANATSLPPSCASSLTRGLMPLSPGITDGCQPPPPATAVQPIQSVDATVVVLGSIKKQCSTSSSGSIKSTHVFSLDIPDPRSPDPYMYQDKSSPMGCGEPLERLPLVGPGGGGNNAGGGVGVGGGAGTGTQQHLEVHPDYHCVEHRHSFPALYYEGSTDSPGQRTSFLTRTKRDTASYSQLSPHHHNYSGYSSSPEYSSESTLRIWERFRPYKKSPKTRHATLLRGTPCARRSNSPRARTCMIFLTTGRVSQRNRSCEMLGLFRQQSRLLHCLIL
ncbi:hypothetical protein AAFF_G00179610 [Aldrovandia affinis]|uniref:LRRCT domain-containing protein n=1 Tax=Aldrovandia affinis TaxID=143900 RepID=A0AAD7RKU0_9TELE|nr:hypothetical protein AAFF_G00179610 [Aldrovandia affinis]